MLHVSFFFPISSHFFIGSFLFHTYPLLAGQLKITLWLLKSSICCPVTSWPTMPGSSLPSCPLHIIHFCFNTTCNLYSGTYYYCL